MEIGETTGTGQVLGADATVTIRDLQELCMMSLVRTAAKRPKFHSNPHKGDQCTALNAFLITELPREASDQKKILSFQSNLLACCRH